MPFETPDRKNLSQIAPAILCWYDGHARVLPWRVGPRQRKRGVKPNPYHVWLSEIMLQQTTVATVASRYHALLKRWPNVKALSATPLDDVLGEWAGLGYYARARNLHKCAIEIATNHDGCFPPSKEELRKLPGIGDYTAAAIAAIAFDKRAIVVDGNIERVISRLFAVRTPLPRAKAEIAEKANMLWPAKQSGDFAQALMDLGALICRPKAPSCEACPVAGQCMAYAARAAERYPLKAVKKKKPHRRGAAFALFNGKGEVLFERRPEKGLLGGMLGLPGTPWAEYLEDDVFAHAPTRQAWEYVGQAMHIFTHFRLTLDVYTSQAPKGFRRNQDQQWIAAGQAQLPTAMGKAVRLAVKEDDRSDKRSLSRQPRRRRAP